MRVHHADHAIIPASKLRNYLLSRRHPVGMHKAAFFRRMGYTRRNWRAFRLALRQHLMDGEIQARADTMYGRKYIVRGIIGGADGAVAVIRSVWIIAPGEL